MKTIPRTDQWDYDDGGADWITAASHTPYYIHCIERNKENEHDINYYVDRGYILWSDASALYIAHAYEDRADQTPDDTTSTYFDDNCNLNTYMLADDMNKE